MATRKRKGATRGRRKSGNTASPLVWALGVLAVGLLVTLLALISIKAPELPEPSPSDTVKLKQQTQRTSKPEPASIPKPKNAGFSFYDELKKQSVIVPSDETSNTQKSAGPLLLPSKPAHSADHQTYILQVGSFKEVQQADQMKARLALLGMKARIEKVVVSDGTWHRVRLGPFATMAEANQLRSRLLAQKIKSMLVKVGQ